MMPWIAQVASACWLRVTCRDVLALDNEDPLVWSKDIERHSAGQFSYAVCEANHPYEDRSQVETGSNAIFVGIYDGHGGYQVAELLENDLFTELIRIVSGRRSMSQVILNRAISRIEKTYLDRARKEHRHNPEIVTMGSCCLAAVIWKGTLLIGNLGDSRAVLGYLNHLQKITAEPLTEDHNVNSEEIRRQVVANHSPESDIVTFTRGAHRIKGIIQVSRSIGDGYLKCQGLEPHASLTKFQLPTPLGEIPAMSAEPSLYTRNFRRRDKFIIFASDGLWDCLTNQEAVEIVAKYPREGIAKRLIKAAQLAAAKRGNMSLKDLRKLAAGPNRREKHDDMTVVVVFLDYDSLGVKLTSTQNQSLKPRRDPVQSIFTTIDHLM